MEHKGSYSAALLDASLRRAPPAGETFGALSGDAPWGQGRGGGGGVCAWKLLQAWLVAESGGACLRQFCPMSAGQWSAAGPDGSPHPPLPLPPRQVSAEPHGTRVAWKPQFSTSVDLRSVLHVPAPQLLIPGSGLKTQKIKHAFIA